MTLIPTAGTVLNMSPATGSVELRSGGYTWELPIVGYAVVVSWVGALDEDGDIEYETSIELVALDKDQYPAPVRAIAKDATPIAQWRVL